MGEDFAAAFDALKALLASRAGDYAVKADRRDEYILETKYPSPYPQHKGQPMFFAAVRRGKAYVSIHLMPLYMNAELHKTISPQLKKRMQGKTCFNFKSAPDPVLLAELNRLTEAAAKCFAKLK